MIEMLESLSVNELLPDGLMWLIPLVLGMIPFVEAYGASVLAIVVGVHPIVAIGGAILGNIATMLLAVWAADRLRSANRSPNELTPRRAKLKRRFDRYGIPLTSVFGQTVLPSQITSAAMVSFGASRKGVIVWQIVAIILWGVAVGGIATVGLQAVEAA